MVADSNALKIGIAKPNGSRITQHTSLGWRLKWRVSVPTGDDAYALEQSVIKWWRETLAVGPAYSNKDMPQGGSTETVSWDATSPAETLEYVLQLAGSLDLEFRTTPSEDVHVQPALPAANRRPGRSRGGRVTPLDLTLF